MIKITPKIKTPIYIKIIKITFKIKTPIDPSYIKGGEDLGGRDPKESLPLGSSLEIIFNNPINIEIMTLRLYPLIPLFLRSL